MTNTMKPNRPYTMEGMPWSVSVVMRMTLTSFEPRFAYSVRYTAAPTPSGTARRRVSAMTSSVLKMAGSMETFSLLNSREKSEGFRFGIPLTRMNPTSSRKKAATSAPESQTSPRRIQEPVWRCFFAIFAPACPIATAVKFSGF